MNILLASDDNYAPLLGVTIYSLLKNNKKDFDNINITVFDNGISEENKTKINEICLKSIIKTNLNFIEIYNLKDKCGLDVNASRPIATYSRLFAASLLDDSIDKILYIDCDALIVDSFKELWQLNIDDYYCGAVLDSGPKYINMFLDLPQHQDHFNAGLLLINLKKWREDNLEKRFVDYLISNNGKVFHNDQGVINVICKDKIYKLPPKYNILSPFFEVKYEKVIQWYDMKEYYSKDIVNNALENPVFIHLTTFVNGRPWFKNAKNHPLRELFDQYANEIPFNNIYTEDTRGWKGKFLSLSYKYLPYSVICSMFRAYEYVLMKKGSGSI